MNEQRIQAYLNLIQQLLTCPDGEGNQILNQAIELVDAGFVQACQLRAQQLQQEGEENQAQFLRDVAQQVVAFLDQQPSGGGGESRETQGHATAEDYFNFLMQILQAIQDSQSSPSVVYHLLQQNLDKLDVNLIQILNNWGSKTLNQVEENQAASIAADIGDFATLIQEFPLGNSINNQEIAVVGYEISLTVFTREQAPEMWASLQNNLGNVYLNCIPRAPTPTRELAFNCYQAALEVFTRDAFPEKWAMTQNNLGNAYLNRIQGEKRQNLELAITCYQDALRVYTQYAFPEKWAGTQNNLGNAYNNRIQGERGQNLELAISYFKAALQVRTPNTFPEKWAETQNNLGNAYRKRIQGEKRQNLELAITCYQDALRVYTQDAFPEKWAGTQNNLGTAYGDRIQGEKRQNLELAIACYQDALQVRTRDAFPEDWVMTQNNLGNTYNNRIQGEKRQNLELAIACYQHVLQVCTRDAFPEDWAMTQNNLGNTYRNLIQGERRQNVELAIASFQAALQVYTQESFPQNHAETLFNLGLAYRDSSQVQNAYKTFVAAIDTVEEIRSGIIIGGEADKQKLAEEWQKLYGNMVEVCLELENYSAALEYAERSKARNLLELMAATRLKPPGVSSEVWERYDALSQELWNLQQQSDNSTFSTLSKTEIIQQSKKLHQEIDTLVEEEITPHNPKFRFGQQVQPMPYREIQALVDDNRAIVEWYFTNKGIHAFIVTRQGEPILVSTDKDAWEGLVQLTSEYVIAYYNTDKSQWRQQFPSYLQRLAEILELDKLLSRIPSHCQELVLVPYRFLHLFPLHALPVSQTEYLSDKFPRGIRYVPSSQILQLSLSQASTPLGKGGEEKSLFAIQNPTTEANLPYADIEVEAIQTPFNPVTVLKGDAASKTGFNQAATQLKDAAFVHFACHGSFDFANPRNSGLILADAKLSETTATEEGSPRIRSQRGEFNPSECLTLPEIFNLRFRQCRLVALSACETGITDIRTSSDEYISILAGFFFAGSRNVLGTLWAVDDLSTAIFMIHFYETLLGENQPPVALAVKQT